LNWSRNFYKKAFTAAENLVFQSEELTLMLGCTKLRHGFPAIVLLSTLLASVAAGAVLVGLARGNGIVMPPLSDIHIRNGGNVEPAGAPIQRVGDNTYTVLSNLPNSSIQVQRSNIVLDGGGFTLSGYGSHWYEGISVSNVTGVRIQNFTIQGFGYGVNLVNSSGNTIIGNKFEGCANGVGLSSSDNNYISRNNVTYGYGVSGYGNFNQIINNNFTSGLSGGGNGMGIYLTGSNNTISWNFIRHEVSINLWLAAYSTVSYNTILDGSSGILLARSSDNVVFGNVVKGKTDSRSGALYISSESYNNTVYENQFENNALGVSLGAQVASSIWNNVSGNTLYRNNFVNNSRNVWIAPGTPVNFWDNGKEGNYWSNYTGSDANGDGIGDTPYVINANNTDYHPLMKPASTNATQTSQPAPSAPTQSSTPATSPSTPDSNSSPPENPQRPSQPSDENPSATPSPSQSGDKKEPSETEKPEPFPTVIAVSACVASAALVVTGLILVSRRRKRQLKDIA
jgi:parallel beta-helix repeat protein